MRLLLPWSRAHTIRPTRTTSTSRNMKGTWYIAVTVLLVALAASNAAASTSRGANSAAKTSEETISHSEQRAVEEPSRTAAIRDPDAPQGRWFGWFGWGHKYPYYQTYHYPSYNYYNSYYCKPKPYYYGGSYNNNYNNNYNTTKHLQLQGRRWRHRRRDQTETGHAARPARCQSHAKADGSGEETDRVHLRGVARRQSRRNKFSPRRSQSAGRCVLLPLGLRAGTVRWMHRKRRAAVLRAGFREAGSLLRKEALTSSKLCNFFFAHRPIFRRPNCLASFSAFSEVPARPHASPLTFRTRAGVS